MNNMQEIASVEQALHGLTLQKQAILSQIAEIQSAISELSADTAYKIIGNLMVKTEPEKMRSQFEKQKETLTTRVKSLEKQEEKLKQELEKAKDKALKVEK